MLMFCSTLQRLAEIMSYEYEIKGKKTLKKNKKWKKKYQVAGNRNLKRSHDKRQGMPLKLRNLSHLFAHKKFA